MLPIHCCFIGSRPNSAWVPPHIPRFPFPCSSSKWHLPDKDHHPVSLVPTPASSVLWAFTRVFPSAWPALPRPLESALVSPLPQLPPRRPPPKPDQGSGLLYQPGGSSAEGLGRPQECPAQCFAHPMLPGASQGEASWTERSRQGWRGPSLGSLPLTLFSVLIPKAQNQTVDLRRSQ